MTAGDGKDGGGGASPDERHVPAVKICGVTRREDAAHADRRGADFVGVVLSEGFRRSVAPDVAASMLVGLSAKRVAVMVDERAVSAAELGRRVSADVLQLHGSEPPERARALRDEGDWQIWKAVRARSVEDVQEAVGAFGDVVDALLIEGWRGSAVGGAGLTLALPAAAVRSVLPSGLDFVLAGGLTPNTVADAVARFRPQVVDVSSGVERTVGVKDPALVEAFIAAARSATLDGRTPPTDES